MKRLYDIIKKYKNSHNLDIKIVIGVENGDPFFYDVPNIKHKNCKRVAYGLGNLDLDDVENFDVLIEKYITGMDSDIEFQLDTEHPEYSEFNQDSIGSVDNSLKTLIKNGFGTELVKD